MSFFVDVLVSESTGRRYVGQTQDVALRVLQHNSVAHWDNSKHTPLNPAPDKTVRFGLQSWKK